MAKLFNRAKMTTSTTGSGTVTLGSASVGYQSFADAGVSNGDVVQYVIEEGGNFEIGTGTYSATGTSLTRSPTESSNSNAAISLGGAATVSITAVADDLNRLQHEGSTKVAPSATGATVTGNLAVTGTVDGRDVAADGAKLDNIEANATADQTAAEIRALVESATDSNVFTDADHTKLNGIESGATADQTAAEIRSLVESATDSNVFTDADHAKLNAIEAGATADQTITAGSGLTGGGTGDVTLSHADTSSQASVNGSGRTYIQDITLDTYGHVTGLATATETVVNTDTVPNDATITINAGNAMTGGGDFTTDQSFNETITLHHADTSSQSSVNNSGRTYIQDITLDGYGHVTGISSATETVTDTNTNRLTTFQLEDGGGTEVTISHGKEVKFVEGGGIDISWTDTSTGSDGDPYDLTFTHADTSSQASVNNSGRTYIQDITLDGYGHVTAISSATETVTNTDTIPNNATITLSAGTNLSGGGAFTTDQSFNETITFNVSSTPSFTSATFGSGVVLSESGDRADLLQISSNTSGWGGLQIRNSSNEGRWSFMTDGAVAGIYDDENGEWHVQWSENAGTTFYYNGVSKVSIGNTYMEMSQHIDMNNYDIYGVDQIFHHGDTNTYMNFHASDQWRVVVGGTERLEVKNSSPHVLVTGDLNSTSDARLKENVEPITNALSDVTQLEGVSFDWKDTGTRGHGFIAQQVEPILPDVVQTDEETGIKSINYVGMIGHLVEAIKELKAEIEELKR
jgi:hypothetical protein